MAETAPASKPSGGSWWTKKAGGLPGWAWVGIGGVGLAAIYILYKRHQASSSSATAAVSGGAPATSQSTSYTTSTSFSTSHVTSSSYVTSTSHVTVTSYAGGTTYSVAQDATQWATVFTAPVHAIPVGTVNQQGGPQITGHYPGAGYGPMPLFTKSGNSYNWIEGPEALKGLKPGTALYTYGDPQHLSAQRGIARAIGINSQGQIDTPLPRAMRQQLKQAPVPS